MMQPNDSHSRSTDRRFVGLMPAVVVDVNDDGKQGRVKVNFPWFDGGASTTTWCRVVQSHAGAGYGTFFVPEVGTEVCVGFGHGDMREPIVVGAFYNGQDKPATWRADDKDQKAIRTPKGHELVFDDTDDAHAITLTTGAGHRLTLDDENEKVELKTKDGHHVEIDDGGDVIRITHKGGTRFELQASKATLEANDIDLVGIVHCKGPGGTTTTINGNEITGS